MQLRFGSQLCRCPEGLKAEERESDTKGLIRLAGLTWIKYPAWGSAVTRVPALWSPTRGEMNYGSARQVTM